MKFLNLEWPAAMIRSCYYGSTALEIGCQPRCSQSSHHLTDQNDYSVILGGSRHSLLALGCPYAYGPCSTVDLRDSLTICFFSSQWNSCIPLLSQLTKEIESQRASQAAQSTPCLHSTDPGHVWLYQAPLKIHVNPFQITTVLEV